MLAQAQVPARHHAVGPAFGLLHKEAQMATDLALDPLLLDQALQLSGEPTHQAAVTLALREFVARRGQQTVTELFGTLDWDAGATTTRQNAAA